MLESQSGKRHNRAWQGYMVGLCTGQSAAFSRWGKASAHAWAVEWNPRHMTLPLPARAGSERINTLTSARGKQKGAAGLAEALCFANLCAEPVCHAEHHVIYFSIMCVS
jgi:hypothetical protein